MKQTVSIVIPVYNEVSRLLDGFREIISYVKKETSYQYEIILVDDGSELPAHTVLLQSSLKKNVEFLIRSKQLRVLRLSRNVGKGGALREGVSKASGSLILFTDIDCSVPLSTMPSMLFELKKSDIVIGSRRLEGSHIIVHQPIIREMAGRIYTRLVDNVLNLQFSDVTCGFKAFKADVAKDLFAALAVTRWSFDAELLYLAAIRGYVVKEFPVSWSNKIGSKVKFVDTMKSFFDLLSIRVRSYPWRSKKSVSVGKAFICDQCGSTDFEFLFDHHHNWKVQKCVLCGLTQILPRPTQKEVSLLYQNDESHFEPYIDQLFVHKRYFHNKLVEMFSSVQTKQKQISNSHTKKQDTYTLLDIGCLTGVLLEEAKKMNIHATGVDISKDAVLYCRSLGLDAYHGTAAAFLKSYPKKKYDFVSAFEIIEHEHSPRTLVETMYELLKPGGIAVLSTPNHGSMWRKIMGKYWPGYTHKEHLYFFDPLSLRRMMETAGFQVVALKVNDARPFPLSFLFTRGADYVPFGKSVFRMIGNILKPFPIQNPVNPWDDLLVIGRK